jgi:hypothetical protein
MFETARLLETVDALLVLRLLVAAESEVELCAPAELLVADEAPREFAKVFEFVPPRVAVEPDAEFAVPLRPMYGEVVVPRLLAEAAEPLLNPRALFADDGEPKCALEGGVTPARLPAL